MILLIVAMILNVISLATEYWLKWPSTETKSSHRGLWRECTDFKMYHNSTCKYEFSSKYVIGKYQSI